MWKIKTCVSRETQEVSAHVLRLRQYIRCGWSGDSRILPKSERSIHKVSSSCSPNSSTLERDRLQRVLLPSSILPPSSWHWAFQIFYLTYFTFLKLPTSKIAQVGDCLYGRIEEVQICCAICWRVVSESCYSSSKGRRTSARTFFWLQNSSTDSTLLAVTF